MTTTIYKITKQTITPIIAGTDSSVKVHVSTPLCLRNGHYDQTAAVIAKKEESKSNYSHIEYFVAKYNSKLDLRLQPVYKTKDNFCGWYDDSYHCGETEEETTEEFGLLVKARGRWQVITNKHAVEALRRKAELIKIERGTLFVGGYSNPADYAAALKQQDTVSENGLYFREFNNIDSDLYGSTITIEDAIEYLLTYK